MLLNNWTPLRSFALLLALLSSSVRAQSGLEPAGMATYTETARDIYLAALLVPAGSSLDNVHLAPGPKAMEYRIATRRISIRGFSGSLLLQAEMGSGSRAQEKVVKVLNQLKQNIRSALLRGDRFIIALSAEDATTFYLNGTELLSVDDGEVFDFFFAGWVGENSSALLRDNLLAGSLNPAIQTRFETLAPGPERIAAVAAWMAPASIPKEQKVVKAAAPAAAQATAPNPAAAIERTEEKPVDEQLQLASLVSAPGLLVERDGSEYRLILDTYVTNVMKKVFGNVKYPRRAVKKSRQGKVELLAHLGQGGELLEITLGNSSGYTILDEAARKAVHLAAPFPELPPEVKEEFVTEDGESYVVMIPVTFRLQNL